MSGTVRRLTASQAGRRTSLQHRCLCEAATTTPGRQRVRLTDPEPSPDTSGPILRVGSGVGRAGCGWTRLVVRIQEGADHQSG